MDNYAITRSFDSPKFSQEAIDAQKQHDIRLGKNRLLLHWVLFKKVILAKSFSRSLLQNERLIWKIRVVIESTIPHVSLKITLVPSS